MSCGCGEPDTRHGDGDITYADLTAAARSARTSVADVLHSMQTTLHDVDGYAVKGAARQSAEAEPEAHVDEDLARAFNEGYTAPIEESDET